MKLAHACDDCLSRLVVGVGLEGGVLLGKFCQSYAHLFLSLLGFRLNRHLDDGVGENHIFQHDRMLFVAQSVARGSFSESYHGDDFAGVGFGNFHPLRRVHLQNLCNPLALALARVVNVSTRFESAAVNAHIRQLAHKRVGDDFERQPAERLVVVGFSLLFLFRLVGIESHDVVDIYRRGKIIGNGVQQKLYSLVFVSRTAENGIELERNHRAAHARLDFLYGNFLAF